MSRDKVSMYLTRITQLSILLLAVVTIVILLGNTQADVSTNNHNLRLESLREELRTVVDGNRVYLENRLNRLQEGQDSYKLTTTREARLLDERLTQLEELTAKSRLHVPKFDNTSQR